MKYTLAEFIAELQKHEPQYGDKTVITLDGDDNGNFYVDDLLIGFLEKTPPEHQLKKTDDKGYFAVRPSNSYPWD